MTFRVMTFNIRGAVPHRDGPNAWEHRAPLTLSLIERTAPDLIGFQELMSGNLETYQKHLSTYQWILGPPTMEETRKNYNAIFWKPSSLDLLKSGGFWLSPTPGQWSRGWGSTYVRAATWAHFRLHETNREFCHINVHLDSVSEEARLQGCLLILAQLASLHLDHLPLLLTGDFNVPTEVDPLMLSIDPSVTNACYRLFLDQGFVDTYHAASKHEAKTEQTYHAFEGEHFSPAFRCDWILSRNETCSFKINSCEILYDAAPPSHLSQRSLSGANRTGAHLIASEMSTIRWTAHRRQAPEGTVNLFAEMQYIHESECKKYKCSSDFNASPPQREEKRETVRSISIVKLTIPKSDWKAVPKRTAQPSLDMMIMEIVTLTMPLLRERAEKWLTFSQWRFLSGGG